MGEASSRPRKPRIETGPDERDVVRELRVLQLACGFARWRWLAEAKRLRSSPGTGPWDLHLGEIRVFHRTWRELRREAGLARDVPPPARRAAERILTEKCRAALSEMRAAH